MKYALPLLLCAVLTAPAMAGEPPAHAPARGYRDQDKQARKEERKDEKAARKYRGYTGVEWREDYGVQSGRCNTDTVLTAVGAVGGAVIGNRTASPENRTIATIVGALIGGVIGNEIGKSIDNTDRACIGHSLEVGAIGREISWTNPKTRVVQTVKPVEDLKDGCRRFEYRTGPKTAPAMMIACRNSQAVWTIRQK